MAKASVIGQRIRRRMLDLNITTVKELENIAGLPRDSVRHMLAGRTSSMRAGKLPQLAAALKMSVEELVGGTPGAAKPSVGVVEQATPDKLAGSVQMDADAAALFGAAAGARLQWLVAAGDSMAPTIQAGDVLLVDVGCAQVDDDGVYVIRGAGGRLLVRRVQLSASGGTVAITPDNRKYMGEPAVALTSLQVFGRVVGAYQRF